MLMSLFSCRLPIEDVDTNLEQDIAVPLFEAKTTVKKMLQGVDSTVSLRFDSDGQITAQFTTSAKAQTFIDPFDGLPSSFVPLMDSVVNIPFAPPGGLKIAMADLKKGKTVFNVSNNLNEAVTIIFRIAQLTKNGITFQKIISLPKGATSIKDSVDLSDFTLKNPNDVIKVQYDARRNSTNQRVVLSNVQIAFSGMQGKYVVGYFGVNRLDVPKDSFSISFIDKLTRGDIRFAEPKITLSLENSFGIPVRTRVNFAEVVTADKKRIALSGSFVSNGSNLNYPTNNEVGQMKTTNIILDKSNSNIVDIASSRPISLVYDIDGIINPDGNKNITGFMLDTSALKMKMTIDIPLYGTIKGFEERDTINFEMPSVDNIRQADFKVITENGTGLNTAMQAYFTDANFRVIDSLYSTTGMTILKAGTVDANGKVTIPSTHESFIKVEQSKLLRLKSAKKVIIKYLFSTANNGVTPVRLNSNQEIKAKIGVIMGIKN